MPSRTRGWIKLGAGEHAAGGREKVSILADALEAYIGALYLDAGADKARDFVVRIMGDRPLNQIDRLLEFDARSHLIRVCVREYSRPPVLEISATGAAHEPVFTATVVVDGESIAEAVGRTKKAAAQAASTEALGDEILHRAGVSPTRPASSVNARQSSRIHEAVHSVLGEAVDAGGSTLGDAQYVDVTGEAGGYQDSHRVYARAGLPCLTCGRGRVVSAVIGGRTTSWCRVCQR